MQTFWRNQAGKVAAQINAARWVEFVGPALAGWSFIAGCLLLAGRRAGWSPRPLSVASGLAIAGIVILGLRRMRRQWFSLQDGLVRLDAVLGLHNRLTSAAVGIGPWPAPMKAMPENLRWKWPRAVGPLLIGAAFLGTAVWLPIPKEETSAGARIEPPLAWTQVETALEDLKKNEVADSQALEALEQKLDALRQQSPDSWYSQSSLEAGAALREETGQGIAALERNLNAAAAALPQPGQQPTSAAPISPEKEALWDQALKGLESGALPMKKAELAALKECNNGKSNLSPEQIRQLQNKLGKMGVSCKSALAKAGQALGNCQMQQLETPQDQPNQPGGGGKTAPLGIRQNPTELATGKEEGLASKDMENAALGDVIQVTVGAHPVDPAAPAKPTAGGAAASQGSGGDAVWKIAPSPKEQAILKEYFK